MAGNPVAKELRRWAQTMERGERSETPQEVWFTTPIAGAGYNGNSFSSVAKTLIDVSAVFAGVPDGIREITLSVDVRDSGSAAGSAMVILWNTNSAAVGQPVRCSGLANDAVGSGQVTIPCNADGDIYIQTVATGAGTLDVFLKAQGYTR